MSRQIQGQQQKVIINLAPKPKRKKRKKKKSKAINSVGDFRTALARSAFIQRGIGGLGFNQGGGGGLPFRRDIDANAVKLNARSFFEGQRREQPNLRSLAEFSADPNPADTSLGSIRGNIHTPRYLDENASFSSIFSSSRGSYLRDLQDDVLSEMGSSTQTGVRGDSSTLDTDSDSTYTPSSDSVDSIFVRPERARRRNQEIQEAEYMGAEDTRRQEDIYSQQGIRIIDPSARARVETQREARREALNSVVEGGSTLGQAEEGSATASLTAPTTAETDTTAELLPQRRRPPTIDTSVKIFEETDYGDDRTDFGEDG